MYVFNASEEIKIIPVVEYIGFAALIFSRFFATLPDY